MLEGHARIANGMAAVSSALAALTTPSPLTDHAPESSDCENNLGMKL